MKKSKAMKKLSAALLAVMLAATSAVPAFSDDTGPLETGPLDSSAFEDKKNVTPDDGNYDVGTDFPEAFDLRDLNGKSYVTPVRSQGLFGTCWAFGTCAAAETSVLYELANDQNLDVDPTEFVFSPLHLAWFTHTPLPADSDYPSQTGEGGTFMNLDGSDTPNQLATGGMTQLTTSAFAMGMGPLYEDYAPYQNKSGNRVSKDGKDICYAVDGEEWSCEEDLRFLSTFELEDANNLPAPVVTKEENGAMVFDRTNFEQANNVIKSELLKGRGIAIGYFADSPSMESLTKEGKFISADWAQYTYQYERANHCVCIVGWDDNYSKEHFLQGEDPDTGVDRTPPADGAWIVKNSWGAEDNEFPDYGTFGVNGSGYFYLSYYDLSISSASSFNFYTDDADEEERYHIIDQYDLMPVSALEGLSDPIPQLMSNIFDVRYDEDLRAVSVETVYPDTEVTYRVYKLNEGAVLPTDGELKKEVTETYDYAGFHRTNFNEPVRFAEGDRYSIVVSQKAGNEYILPVNCGLNKAGAEMYVNNPAFVAQLKSIGAKSMNYSVGVINRGESFFAAQNENGEYDWYDWVDISEAIKIAVPEYAAQANIIDFDNVPVKGYASPVIEDPEDSSEPDESSQPEDSSEPEDSNVPEDSSQPEESSAAETSKPTDDSKGGNPNTGAAAIGFAAVTVLAAGITVTKKRSK